MTTRARRTLEVDADRETVWSYISDPAFRADAISVVESYEPTPGENRRVTWHVVLPIPFVRATIPIETEELSRNPPGQVTFRGDSRVMSVTGEHTLEETEDGTRLVTELTVEGSVPGVETYFKRNLDDELDNLLAALERELEASA